MLVSFRIGPFEVAAILFVVAVMLGAYAWASEALAPDDALAGAHPDLVPGLLIESGYQIDATLPTGELVVRDGWNRRYVCEIDVGTSTLTRCAPIKPR